jgi:hypothetical protein
MEWVVLIFVLLSTLVLGIYEYRKSSNLQIFMAMIAIWTLGWGLYEYHQNSKLQIYLARKQIYNPLYQQLDLSLREFYDSTGGLFFGNKGQMQKIQNKKKFCF